MIARVGLALGALFLAGMPLLDAPAGMSVAAWRVAAVGLCMAIWWVTEALPVAATALLPLVAFPLLGVATPTAAAAPFANPVIFLFLGGFLLAAALERSGLHRRLALAVIGAAGTRPDRLVLGFMVATAAISMWVSNTATVVMVLPLATPVLALFDADGATAADRHAFEAALLLGVAYAASIGGLGTPVGTPPNALAIGFLRETHGVRIGFAEWMRVAMPVVIVATPLAWLLLTRVAFRVRGGASPAAAATVAAQRAVQGAATRDEWAVGTVAALAAVAWVTLPLLESRVPGLSEAGVGIAAALVLFVLPARDGGRLLTWEAAQNVPWGVLLLFGGGLSLAAAIQSSGLAARLGDALAGLRGLPLPVVLLLVTTVVVFLTEFTSNTATAAAFLPLVSSLAVAIAVDPVRLAIPAALASSIGFMMPVGTPPNALVYATGRVGMREMVRAGLLLNVLLIVLVASAGMLLL